MKADWTIIETTERHSVYDMTDDEQRYGLLVQAAGLKGKHFEIIDLKKTYDGGLSYKIAVSPKLLSFLESENPKQNGVVYWVVDERDPENNFTEVKTLHAAEKIAAQLNRAAGYERYSVIGYGVEENGMSQIKNPLGQWIDGKHIDGIVLDTTTNDVATEGGSVYIGFKNGASIHIYKAKDVTTKGNLPLTRNPKAPNPRSGKVTWTLWSYDVWGNADDGYEVNGRRAVSRSVELPADPTDAQIRKVIKEYWDIGSSKLDIDGDDMAIYVNRAKDGYPLAGLERND